MMNPDRGKTEEGENVRQSLNTRSWQPAQLKLLESPAGSESEKASMNVKGPPSQL